MNIQKVSSSGFVDIYYKKQNTYFKVTPNQRKVWPIVYNRLNPYNSDIVPALEKQAEVDIVLFFNSDGTTSLKLIDISDKFANKDFNNPNTIANTRSPKIAVTFTNQEQENEKSITSKLDQFIDTCKGYLKMIDSN